MKTLVSAFVAMLVAGALCALDAKASGQGGAKPLAPPARAGQGPPASKSETDANGDGAADFVIFFDSRGRKEREELDFNFDGKMDDMLYYTDGVLTREEIDSDFDGAIDVWVYLDGGVYVKRYERDLNGDGVPDVVKDFGQKK